MTITIRTITTAIALCWLLSDYLQRHNEWRSRNYFCGAKAINTKFYDCVSVAWVIHHEMWMRRVIFSSVARQTLLYFSTLSHKQRDFQENMHIRVMFNTYIKKISRIVVYTQYIDWYPASFLYIRIYKHNGDTLSKNCVSYFFYNIFLKHFSEI